MGKTVRELEQAGLRHFGSGGSRCSGDSWFAGALTRENGDRLAAEDCREPGAGQYCLVVRGFDNPRIVPSQVASSRLAARSGVPTARLARRVVGHTVRGNEILGSPTLAQVTPSVTGRALVVVL